MQSYNIFSQIEHIFSKTTYISDILCIFVLLKLLQKFKSMQSHIYNDSQNGTAERKTSLLSQCRYYKGETKCPPHIKNSLFWDYEKAWVEALTENDGRAEIWKTNFERAHLQPVAEKYGVPDTLLGLLYNRFMHWGSGYETINDFAHWIGKEYL